MRMLFLISLILYFCTVSATPSCELQNISKTSQQMVELKVAMDQVIQSLLQQGYSTDQVVELFKDALDQAACQNDKRDKDNTWKWVGLGVLGAVVGGYCLWKCFRGADAPAEQPDQGVGGYDRVFGRQNQPSVGNQNNQQQGNRLNQQEEILIRDLNSERERLENYERDRARRREEQARVNQEFERQREEIENRAQEQLENLREQEQEINRDQRNLLAEIEAAAQRHAERNQLLAEQGRAYQDRVRELNQAMLRDLRSAPEGDRQGIMADYRRRIEEEQNCFRNS